MTLDWKAHGTGVGVSALEEEVVIKIHAVFRPGAYKREAHTLPNRVGGQNIY